jgi:hypothetical protein
MAIFKKGDVTELKSGSMADPEIEGRPGTKFIQKSTLSIR